MEYMKILQFFEFDPKTHKPFLLTEVWKELNFINWIATEDIDGTNVCVLWDGNSISFAGRRSRSLIPPHLLGYLEKALLTDDAKEAFKQIFGNKQAVIFGKGFGPKIETGGELYGDTPGFAVTDIRIGKSWLSRANVEDVSAKLGLQCVPVVGIGTLNGCYSFIERNPRSFISPKHEMAGIVCTTSYPLYDRNGNPIKVKISFKDIKEVQKKVWKQSEAC